jgi:hypothetical protein
MHSLKILLACTLVGCSGAEFTTVDASKEAADGEAPMADVAPAAMSASGDGSTATVDAGVRVHDDGPAEAVDSGMPDRDAASPILGGDGGCIDRPAIPGDGATFIGTNTLSTPYTLENVPTPEACRCAATYTCECLQAETKYCSIAGKSIASCTVTTNGPINIECSP